MAKLGLILQVPKRVQNALKGHLQAFSAAAHWKQRSKQAHIASVTIQTYIHQLGLKSKHPIEKCSHFECHQQDEAAT